MKRYHRILAIITGAAMLAGCSADGLAPDSGKAGESSSSLPVITKAVNTMAEADRSTLLLFLDDAEASASEGICEAVKATGALSVRRAIPCAKGKEAQHRKYGLDRWFVVTLPEDADLETAAEKFASVAEVEKIQFNTRMQKNWSGTVRAYVPTRAVSQDMVFNDPMLADQWHYDNIGDTYVSLYSKPGADIGVSDAWRLSGGDSRIIVAVVDEGVKYTHPDLAANMWVNAKEISGNSTDDDDNGYADDIHGYNFVSGGEITWAKEDDSGHGTHVAGTVAAVNDNGTGVCGVAGGTGKGDGVRIMSCQIYDGEEGGTVDCTAAAFTYAADNGASILQCSFGYPAGVNITSDEMYESAARLEVAALEYFLDNAECPVFEDGGGLAIFAAGNDGASTSAYPAAYRKCISVTSVGPDMLPTVYTNYGPGSNIAAPGGEIAIGNESRAGVLSTIPSEVEATGSDYGYLEGTSMACPHVSGVAALGLSYALQQGLSFTKEEFTSMLLTSVDDIEYYLNGTKDYSTSPLVLSRYRKQMGTGLIDTWKLFMQIEGTPCLTAEIGEKTMLDLDLYFGGSAGNLTYTGYEMSEEDREALGLAEDPELRYGKLFLVCTKPGAAKITVKAIAGGPVEGTGQNIGGIPVSKEISIIARGVRSENGGWL